MCPDGIMRLFWGPHAGRRHYSHMFDVSELDAQLGISTPTARIIPLVELMLVLSPRVLWGFEGFDSLPNKSNSVFALIIGGCGNPSNDNGACRTGPSLRRN